MLISLLWLYAFTFRFTIHFSIFLNMLGFVCVMVCVCASMYTLHVWLFTEEDARQAASASSRKRTLLDDIEKAMNGKWFGPVFLIVFLLLTSLPSPPPPLKKFYKTFRVSICCLVLHCGHFHLVDFKVIFHWVCFRRPNTAAWRSGEGAGELCLKNSSLINTAILFHVVLDLKRLLLKEWANLL